MSARLMMVMMEFGGWVRKTSCNIVLLELFAQGVAVQAEYFRCLALVAVGAVHHELQQRLFHALDEHVIHRVRRFAVKILEIFFQRVAYAGGKVSFMHHATI